MEIINTRPNKNDSFARVLPDGEYDISKEDFDSSKSEYMQLKKKTKSKTASTSPTLDNTTENDLTKRYMLRKRTFTNFSDALVNGNNSEDLTSVKLPKRPRKTSESVSQHTDCGDGSIKKKKEVVQNTNIVSNDENLKVFRIKKNSATITNRKRNTRQRQNSTRTSDDIPINDNKRKSQRKKSSRFQCPEQPTYKVNVAEKSKKKIFQKMRKLTKERIKEVSTRKIPKKRLDDVLDMVDNDDHSVWEDRNISCNPCIHLYWETRSSVLNQNVKLKYARQFLLRRDWISLSKVLFASNLGTKAYYFPLLSKYATLLMAHTDKERFDKIVQFLTSTKDSSSVMKKCTEIKKANNIHTIHK